MYAICTCSYNSAQQPSGKADGMFVRKDGMCYTDKKSSAAIFDTAEEAEKFAAVFTENGYDNPLFILEIETMPVMKKITRVIKKL